jgi:putative MATE family efflux protein
MTVLAAQYWGKKDKKTTGEALAIAMHFSLAVGLIFSAAAVLMPELLMRIFTSDQKLIDAGSDYLRIVSPTYFLTGFSQVYFGIMKVCDRAKLSSLIGSLAVILNIILNGCLIFGLWIIPEMGITGAALATLIAKLFEAGFVIAAASKGKCIKLDIKQALRPRNRQLGRDYRKYMLPMLINLCGWGLGVTMYSVIMGHLGTDATAANSIASIVRHMIASLCWGIASGTGIIIGGMLGRGEFEKAKRSAGSLVRCSIYLGAASGLVILALTPLVTSVVKLDPQAKHYLRYMMFFAAYYIIGNSLNSTVITGIFAAGGDTRFGMICDIITLWAVVVPLGMVCAFVLKLPVLVVAAVLTLDEFVKLPAVYWNYKKYNWVKDITQPQSA